VFPNSSCQKGSALNTAQTLIFPAHVSGAPINATERPVSIGKPLKMRETSPVPAPGRVWQEDGYCRS
jgi:hypothetical protein